MALLCSSAGLARRLPVGILSVLIEHLPLVFTANSMFQVGGTAAGGGKLSGTVLPAPIPRETSPGKLAPDLMPVLCKTAAR